MSVLLLQWSWYTWWDSQQDTFTYVSPERKQQWLAVFNYLCGFSLLHMRSTRARRGVQERVMWWPNNILFAASDGRHERSWWNFLTQPDYKILCEVEPKRRHYVRRTAAPFSPSVSAAARYKLSNGRTLREGIFLSANKSVHMSRENDTCNWHKVAK
jgi:hypothetical protein